MQVNTFILPIVKKKSWHILGAQYTNIEWMNYRNKN